ncbi:hypothetical protein C8R44DRAFT_741985 [Mycena epipterygia]|nr:hypothetical protein C8R44DRAFT_741985 [Mycena epipterygia]
MPPAVNSPVVGGICYSRIEETNKEFFKDPMALRGGVEPRASPNDQQVLRDEMIPPILEDWVSSISTASYANMLVPSLTEISIFRKSGQKMYYIPHMPPRGVESLLPIAVTQSPQPSRANHNFSHGYNGEPGCEVTCPVLCLAYSAASKRHRVKKRVNAGSGLMEDVEGQAGYPAYEMIVPVRDFSSFAPALINTEYLHVPEPYRLVARFGRGLHLTATSTLLCCTRRRDIVPEWGMCEEHDAPCCEPRSLEVAWVRHAWDHSRRRYLDPDEVERGRTAREPRRDEEKMQGGLWKAEWDSGIHRQIGRGYRHAETRCRVEDEGCTKAR